ncbi:MAG: hypothetical protein Q9172_006087 [Xanthocarpia lactea]
MSEILVDPFSLLVICLDELWLQSQRIVDIVRKIFGDKERAALELTYATNTVDGHHDFVGLHNIAKHIIHLKEGADAAHSTTTHLQAFHQGLLEQPPQGPHATQVMRLTNQMLAQKTVQFEVWKLRMTSLEQRMQNIINLVRENKWAAPYLRLGNDFVFSPSTS